MDTYDALILGLGRMGLPMAGHMRKAGLSVKGYDPHPGRMHLLAQSGGEVVEDLATAIAAADAVLVMVGSEKQVTDLFDSPDGLIAHARPGTLVLVISTVSPKFVQALGARAAERGIRVVDAPVCRAEMGAIAGTLLTLLSGPPADCADAELLMRPFSADIEHVGERLGAAQVAKTVNNMILWAAVTANYEGFMLAEKWGLNIAALRRALTTSSADNWSLRHWDRVGEMPWSLKDMEIALATGEELGVAMPVSETVSEELRKLPLLSHA
ncbi:MULTISPECIES: NAD(P)-dependent oxidoreductase [unclassified Chelatococcus]|uniref:NAD(P)-dependent oxidoreductase n=1 Tax=unclassified Chelatococcus TaxID=2638111 RepID=UPI001BD0540F|nr:MULTISPECIES: NAD(P)-dependent oxidoreductase [unclassified Chelatococcus]MBS7700619.1 NAD(P)-dependent oxidoreductase [Chelatococcus sp. YT9]MBX3559050.1 NAD(P)-dependent oxidoreductase [Chelatococcus sp.]